MWGKDQEDINGRLDTEKGKIRFGGPRSDYLRRKGKVLKAEKTPRPDPKNTTT